MNNFQQRPGAMMGGAFPPGMQQPSQQPQQHPQQGIPTQIREFIFARIRAQGIVPTGWQTQVSEAQRAGSVLHIYTSFRLARPPPGPEEARSMLNQTVLFESKVFTVSTSREQYQSAIQGKLTQLSEMRGRQAPNVPLGSANNLNMQAQANQNLMQQQQQLGLMTQPPFNPSFNPQMQQQMGAGPGGPQTSMSQIPRPNPMAQQQQQQSQQNNTNGNNNSNNNMQQMLSRAGQAFPNQNLNLNPNSGPQLQNQKRPQQPQQQQQQQQPPPSQPQNQPQPNQQSQPQSGQQQHQQQPVRALALPQNEADRREVLHMVQILVQQLKSQGRFEEMQRECMQRSSPSQQEQMRISGTTPFDMWVRKKALDICQRRKQNAQSQGQTNVGNMGRNHQPGQQGVGGMQGLSSGSGGNGSLSFGSFLSQQTEANRAQEAGEPVVPASNNNQTFGQQGGKQNIFNNMTNGPQSSANSGPMGGMNGGMGGNNGPMGLPNAMGSMQQQQQFAQNQQNRGTAPNNQTQNRLQTPMNNNRPNSSVLMGHGIQGGPQQSPAMHVLNRAMGPPGDQNRNEKPPERSIGPVQQSGQPNQQGAQSGRPNISQPASGPPIPPAMMEQLSQRLAGIPPEQRAKAMAQFQATFRQRQMQSQMNRANGTSGGGKTGNTDQAKNQLSQNINGSQGPSNAPHPAGIGGQMQPGIPMKPSDPNSLTLPRGVLAQNLPELQLPPGIGTWGQLNFFLKQNPGYLNPMSMQKLHAIHSAHFQKVMESRQQPGMGPQSQQQPQQPQQQQQQHPAQQRPQMPQQPLQIPPTQTSLAQSSQLVQHPANLQMPNDAGVPVPPNRMEEAQKLVRENVLQFAGPNLVKISATEQEVANAKQQILMTGQGNAQNTSDLEVRKKICLSKLRRVQSMDPYWAQKLFLHTHKSFGLSNDSQKQPTSGAGPELGQLANRPLMGPTAPAFPGGMHNQQPQPGMLGPMMNGRPQSGQMSPSGLNTGPMGLNNNSNMQGQAPQMHQAFNRATSFKQPGMEPPNGMNPMQANQLEAMKSRAMQGASRQQAAVNNMMASARAGPLVPPEQREARWKEIEAEAQRIVSMRTASQGPSPSIDVDYWASRVGQFINSGMQMYPGAIRSFFMSGGAETLARDLRTAVEFLRSQQTPNGEFRFTLSGDELRDIFTKIVTFSQAFGKGPPGPSANQQRQQPGTSAPSSGSVGGPAVSNAPTAAAAASTAPPQPKKPAAAKNNQKPPQAQSSSQPPFQIGQPTPDGKPYYAQGNEITQDQLKLPSSKRRKLNNQSTPKDTGKTTPIQPADAQASAPQTTAKAAGSTAPQPELVAKDLPNKCSIPGCDMNRIGFQKAEERKEHEKDVHGYTGNALDFCITSLRKALGTNETSLGRPAGAAKTSNRALPAGTGKMLGSTEQTLIKGLSSPPDSWTSSTISAEEINDVFEDMEGISTQQPGGVGAVQFMNPPTPPATPPADEKPGAGRSGNLPPILNWDPFAPGVDKNEIKPLSARDAAFDARELRLLEEGETMDFSWEFLDAEDGSPFRDFEPIDLEKELMEMDNDA